jgi:DNA-3-methyladenine glycosylase
MVSEVEAYRGEEDEACHARYGKTRRNQVMYNPGGCAYVYLIYGMYWMFNIVTGPPGDPQAVLIRGVPGFAGPGKLTRALGIDSSFYGEDLVTSQRLWLEDGSLKPRIIQKPRVGIDYAGEPWKSKAWRYILLSPD